MVQILVNALVIVFMLIVFLAALTGVYDAAKRYNKENGINESPVVFVVLYLGMITGIVGLFTAIPMLLLLFGRL